MPFLKFILLKLQPGTLIKYTLGSSANIKKYIDFTDICNTYSLPRVCVIPKVHAIYESDSCQEHRRINNREKMSIAIAVFKIHWLLRADLSSSRLPVKISLGWSLRIIAINIFIIDFISIVYMLIEYTIWPSLHGKYRW